VVLARTINKEAAPHVTLDNVLRVNKPENRYGSGGHILCEFLLKIHRDLFMCARIGGVPSNLQPIPLQGLSTFFLY
jgi:hypothetical protein